MILLVEFKHARPSDLIRILLWDFVPWFKHLGFIPHMSISRGGAWSVLCTKQREGEDDLGGGGGRSVGIVFFSCYHEMGLGMVFAVFFFLLPGRVQVGWVICWYDQFTSDSQVAWLAYPTYHVRQVNFPLSFMFQIATYVIHILFACRLHTSCLSIGSDVHHYVDVSYYSLA